MDKLRSKYGALKKSSDTHARAEEALQMNAALLQSARDGCFAELVSLLHVYY